MTFHGMKNLTTWVRPETLEEWDNIRVQESSNPDKPLTWSSWIAEKVRIAVNINQVTISEDTEDNVPGLQASLHNRQNEIDKLRKRITELESKEMGVSDDRIIRILSKDYTAFDDIVQNLINTEAENAFTTIQKLAISGIVESDTTGNKWRLKS